MSKLRHRESWDSRTKKELEEMDYKEKYEKALKQAKKFHTSDSNNNNLKAVLELIFPQLAGSEDERIRKAIIHYILYETKGTISEATEHTWVKWLEKQKEQKPAEWTEEDEKKMDWLLECLAAWKYQVPEFKDEYQVTYDWLESLPERFSLQPKQEWSEADEVYLQDALWCVEKAENSCKDGEDKGACWSARRWLKSLRPQPKQERSEEDEKKINFLSRLIEFQVKDDEYCFGDGRLISKQEAIEMLKSLRPVSKESLQPHWKPSEEQMGAFKSKLPIIKGTGNNVDSILESLYNDLKKLI